MPKSLHSIRGVMSCCHLLENGDESVMIDAGLIGEPVFVSRLVHKLGLKPTSIKAILLTHGHLDHVGNLAWLKHWSGARVLAHAEEAQHVAGTYPYTGIARWCGRLESLGRCLTRYNAATVDEFIVEGQELPFWGGLRVVHLPGHSAGHCGFFSARHDLLFSGDMFASYFFNVHKPPAILNSVPELFAASVEKIRQLAPRLLVPNHYDVLNGELHRRRFCRLFKVPDWLTSSTAAGLASRSGR